ncbi:MAG: YitT family protein [Cellulosilyticum sp.]|nr:YitT family protein [Cellulosilyticum sp.]
MERQAKLYGGIVIGASLIAIGLYFFWAPSDLAAGGVSGLSIVIKALIPSIPLGVIIFVLDMIMFIIGFVALGKSFGAKSLICSITVSTIMTLLEWIWPNWQPISEDQLILLLFGGLFIAMGQAIVFNLEASSGGTDIIAKIMTRYMPLNIGTALMIADMIVVLLATMVFGLEKGLYAALGVIVVTQLIDYMIAGFNVQKYVIIVSSNEQKANEINEYILKVLERGTTLYKAEGGYSGEEKSIITTVIGRKEFLELKKQLMHVDRLAFMMVQNIHEVIGEGF